MAVLVDLWGQLERSTEFVLQVLQEAAGNYNCRIV